MAAPMTITACSLTKKSPPTAPKPFYHQDKMLFQCEDFLVGGTVDLGTPAAGPPAVREFFLPRVLSSPVGLGWRAAWIQLCCQEEVWGIYRGAAPADGSMLARWPATESFDTESRDNRELWVTLKRGFYAGLSASSPTCSLEFKDAPQHYFETSLTNTMTGRPNVLAVAVVRLSFILALAAKDPDDNLHVLKHMAWWARWESTFTGPADGLTDSPVTRRTNAGQGNPQDGAPPKLVQALKNPSFSSSNVLAQDCVETSYRNWKDLSHLRPLPKLR